MTVFYEWDIETVDAEPIPLEGGGVDHDIIDHHHCNTLAEFKARDFLPFHGQFKRLVLVYNEGNESDGIRARAWAYVEANKLPEHFTYGMDEQGPKVPWRFHDELRRWLDQSPAHAAATRGAGSAEAI